MNDEQVQAIALWHAARVRKHLTTQALSAEYFDREGGLVLTLLRKMLATGKTASLRGAMLMPEMTPEAAKLAAAVDAMSTPDIGFDQCVEHLEERHTRARIRLVCQQGFDDSFDRTKPVSSIVSGVASSALRITKTRSDTVQRMANFAGVNADIHYLCNNPGKLAGYSTGFDQLDRTLNGLTAQYYVIGGRPSAGKTALEGDLVKALLMADVGVAEFSLEMSADAKRKRYLAKLSGVSLTTYRQSAFSSSELAMIKKAQERMDTWNHWIDDNPASSIDDIEVKATMLVEHEGVRAITIDYLQLIQNRRYKDRFEALGDISNRLKALGARLKIPVVVLAQLKRADARFDPQLKRTVIPKPRIDDFRECGNIEQDADGCILIHRDHIFSPQDAELIVAKQRNGPTHSGIEMNYHPGGVMFSEKKNS